MLIRSLYRANSIPKSTSPISQCMYYLAGQFFIDDSDFNIINKNREDKFMIVKRVQQVLKVWHHNLQITGGQLKLTKYY